MARSKEHFVPVKDGILRGSGYVELNADGELRVTLGFGGPAGAYAVPQHERLDYRHTVGEAKYLEKPLMAAASTLAADLAASIREEVGV
jgi:hypothetical protein